MEYEITSGTLAIVPNEIDSSVVYEDEERYIIKQTPFKIMENSCLYFGSSYNGRKEGSRNILGADYKVPIIVDEAENLILFPTTSPKSDDCVWICLNHLKSYDKIDNFNTKITFNNNREIIVPCSFRTVENQVSRASRLDFVMRNRKKR